MGREWYWSARAEGESPGCMSGMLNFFDFHQLLFSANTSSGTARAPPDSSPQYHHPSPQHKGVEAPRNSLELDEAAASTSAVGEEYFDVPKTKKSSLLEEERRGLQSGTPRTPNVVARLMGLEVLPDLASPPPPVHRRCPPHKSPSTPTTETQERFQKKIRMKKKQCADECRKGSPPPRRPLQTLNCNSLTQVRSESGSRSLPETPRVSSARSLDADPRLSLQINKDHGNRAMHEFSCFYIDGCADYSVPPPPSPHPIKSRKRDCLRHQDENKSPRSHYDSAPELAKQGVSSRAGGCGEEHAVRSRRTRPASRYDETSNRLSKQYSEVQPPLLCSPPSSRFLEPPPKPLQPLPKAQDHAEGKKLKVASNQLNKKASSYERYMERMKRTPSPPETMAAVAQNQLRRSDNKRKCGSQPLSRPLPTEKVSKSFPSPVHEQEQIALKPLSTPKGHQRRLPMERDPEFRYVRSILEHAGFMATAAHSVRWYSPSLPIDPIIFHQLELELRLSNEVEGGLRRTAKEEEGELLLGPLRHPWNRKLLFHLVEELLGDLLSTAARHVGGRTRWRGGGESLLRLLWSQIRSFPSADCRVVGDIDALVDGDLPESRVRELLRHSSVVEEAEDIASEIERNIFDSLIGEAAASLALFRGSRTGGRLTSAVVTVVPVGCDRYSVRPSETAGAQIMSSGIHRTVARSR